MASSASYKTLGKLTFIYIGDIYDIIGIKKIKIHSISVHLCSDKKRKIMIKFSANEVLEIKATDGPTMFFMCSSKNWDASLLFLLFLYLLFLLTALL